MTLPGWTRTLALWHQAANSKALLALPTITLGPYMFGLDHPWPADEAEALLQAWRAA